MPTSVYAQDPYALALLLSAQNPTVLAALQHVQQSLNMPQLSAVLQRSVQQIQQAQLAQAQPPVWMHLSLSLYIYVPFKNVFVTRFPY
jgi:hypothetical protein